MKADYNNLYIHFVFTTSNRLPIINEQHRNRIEKYITGVVKNHKCRLYAIYANPEHMHFLLSKNSSISSVNNLDFIGRMEPTCLKINYMRACLPKKAFRQVCEGISCGFQKIRLQLPLLMLHLLL